MHRADADIGYFGGTWKAEGVGHHFCCVFRLHQQVRLIGAAFFSNNFATRGVAVRPGQTLKTRMPRTFTSSRKLSAIERNPCCVAENCPVVVALRVAWRGEDFAHEAGLTSSISEKKPSASVGWMYTAPFSSV